MNLRIELDAPQIGELEKKYINEAIDSGFISSVGPFIPQFEQKIADYLGVKGAVAVQNGTAALFMALYESGVGPGDEVIVPSLTFAATVSPVLHVGATPVIVDVDDKTWNMDPAQIRGAITARTKAILPVHLYGNPCQMQEITAISQQHGLCVIEDATESLGSVFNGRHTGTFGDFGCFSFNGNKLITTGGGGMVVGNDVKKIEHIRCLVNQAKDKDKPGFHSELGFNFRMTNIEAAIGLAQFDQINRFLKKKEMFKAIYRQVLGGIPGVCFQHQYGNAAENGWLTCIRIKGADIVEVMQALKDKGIPTRRIFVPVSEMPYLKQNAKSCPQAMAIYNESLCLPCSTLNEELGIKEAASIIRDIIGAYVHS